jgi:predicted RNA-binding protein with PIN domain
LRIRRENCGFIVAKTYLIDGYNVLLRWRRGGIQRGPGNLEAARDAFVHWIARRAENPGQYAVVFDASSTPRTGLVETHVGGVRVIFAEGYASADEYIIAACQGRPKPTSDHVVVTADRSIQMSARRCHWLVESADEFLERLSRLKEDDLADEASPQQPTPRRNSKPTALLGEDLQAFREAMGESGAHESPLQEDSSRPATSPSKKRDSSKNVTSYEDLSDFYRQMREDLDQE